MQEKIFDDIRLFLTENEGKGILYLLAQVLGVSFVQEERIGNQE